MIYFISNLTNGSIKIGFTKGDPMARLRQLQTGHSDRLELRGSVPGDLDYEKHLHRRFAKHRISGEWFRPDDELIRWILAVLNPPQKYDQLDYSLLNPICRYRGDMTVDSEDLPLVDPLDESVNHMDFDRVLCEAGLKKYIRKTVESDKLGQDIDFGPYVIVEELAKGIRSRLSLGSVLYFEEDTP